jgi:hypothetical protein
MRGMPRRKKPKPYEKPTEKEQEARVRAAIAMLRKGKYKHEIKHYFSEKWRLSPRTVERYLTRARDQIVTEENTDRDEQRALSASFYRKMAQDRAVPAGSRLFARKRIDELYGLDAPKKLMQSVDVRESVVDIFTSPEVLDAASRLNGAAQHNGNGAATPTNGKAEAQPGPDRNGGSLEG